MEGLPTAVVYDPYPLWLDGVRQVLERVGVAVAAATTDEARAVERVRDLRPDLLVTASVSVLGGLAAPAPRTVVLAGGDASEVDAAFAAGASAYVLKTAHPDDLATAVRQAFAQTVYTVSRTSPAPHVPGALDVLTRRQREILALVADGRSNAEVAAQLWVSRQTVKFHLASIYRTLGVANRTEAARWAHEHGLLDGRPRALAA